MTDDKRPKDVDGVKSLVKVLSKYYEGLTAAGSDQALLRHYSALLKFLRSAGKEEIDRIFSRPPTARPNSPQSQPQYTDAEITNCSTAQLEKFLNDEGTPRKLLERIAIHRFNVPAGSMRSFSNRRMLVDKLLTLIRNEQAHTTIDSVARR